MVMMTAHGNIDAAVEAMKAGATDFLTKPLDYAMLYALLEATASDVRQRRGSQSLDRPPRATDAGRRHGRTESLDARDSSAPSRCWPPATRRRSSRGKAARAKRSWRAPFTR